MDGLIVLEPYASLIINGDKKWELRSREPPSTKLDKELYLLSKGKTLGIIKIINTHGPLQKKELEKTYAYHKSDLNNVDDDFETFVWELDVCEKFPERKQYAHPNGAQVWVKNVVLRNDQHKQRINSYF